MSSFPEDQILVWQSPSTPVSSIKCTNYAPTKVGGLTGSDLYCIAAAAPHPTAAYAVLNAALAPVGNSLMSSFQFTAVVNPKSVPLLPKKQQHLFPYSDIDGYLATNPLWTSPPPTVSDSSLASLSTGAQAGFAAFERAGRPRP